jgi:hypothetical protein
MVYRYAALGEEHLDLAQVVVGAAEIDGEPLPGAGTVRVPGRRRVSVDRRSGGRRAAARGGGGPEFGGDVALDRLDVGGALDGVRRLGSCQHPGRHGRQDGECRGDT